MTSTPINRQTRKLATSLFRREQRSRRPITGFDRCDRCHVAAAQARLTTAGGSEVYLCMNHFRLHCEAIDADPNLLVHLNTETGKR